MIDRASQYDSGSLSLAGTVAMGTGVMIGAGIFALTGQIAELAGGLFPLAFLLAAGVSAFSAYAYVKGSSAYPSAGGIAMILKRAYGPSTTTGAAALLMAFSMIINESLVARTFAAYVLRLAPDAEPSGWWTPAIAVGLIGLAFAVNVAGNRFIEAISDVAAVLKIGGLLAFAAIAVAASGVDLRIQPWPPSGDPTVGGFAGSVALGILAFKGFTTITNSGDEVVEPEKNVGRAIAISLVVCLVVYLGVSYGLAASLSIDELVEARDYSLAEAARPALGGYGTLMTVLIALIATASGLLASIFAVSRMLAMLTEMELIPHRHLGMPGDVQKHTLVYTVVLAALLAALFDLTRIASMGAILYLVMDITIQWGVLRHLRDDVGANATVVSIAIVLDAAALAGFVLVKGTQDPLIVVVSALGIAAVTGFERFYLRSRRSEVAA